MFKHDDKLTDSLNFSLINITFSEDKRHFWRHFLERKLLANSTSGKVITCISLPLANPEGTWCKNDAVWTSMWRHHVTSTFIRRHFGTKCPLEKLSIQWTLFITAFIITAKFVITSIQSAQKSADHVLFHWQFHVTLWENIHFGYLLESPRRGDSNKYTKRMIYKSTVKKISIIHTLDGSISSFFITANSILQQNLW